MRSTTPVIICWFSCGVTSAVACILAMLEYGRSNCVFIYIDHGVVHPDNERYISDFEKQFSVNIMRVKPKNYTDQFDVIERTRFVNGPMGARCSVELKKSTRFGIEREFNFVAQVFGFEYERGEINRAIKFQKQYPSAKAIFPLIDERWSKANCMGFLESHEIATPIMYTLGYNNNNCIGCVKGGAGYWNKIRKDFPGEFLRMAILERKIGRSCMTRKFLDKLEPNEGYKEKTIVPDCGPFCEIEGVEFEDTLVSFTLKGEHKLTDKQEIHSLLGSTQHNKLSSV